MNNNVNQIEGINNDRTGDNGKCSNISTASVHLDLDEVMLPIGISAKGLHFGASASFTDEDVKIECGTLERLAMNFFNGWVKDIASSALKMKEESHKGYLEESKAHTEESKARAEHYKAQEKRDQERHELEMKELKARVSKAEKQNN